MSRIPLFGGATASLALLLLLASASAGSAGGGQASTYVIGPQDVLTIATFDQADLSGRFTVELDGTLSFPLIGRVQAQGMTVRDLEVELKSRLGDGFINKPQVTVAIDQYRSQRVFVVGEVRNAGTYPLTMGMTLIEALAKAGSTTGAASDYVVVVRGDGAAVARLPDDQAAREVTRVDLEDLQTGAPAVRNLGLRDGDTIYVPRANLVFLFGAVKNPGSYPIQSGTTVLQALSLAGGVLPTGATNRLKGTRVVNGVSQEIKMKLTDTVQPGDTIVVPERFF